MPFKKARDVFPDYVAQMKIAWERDTIRMLDMHRFRDWHVSIKHPVYSNISGTRLVDQPIHWNHVEVSFDPVRVEARRETGGA